MSAESREKIRLSLTGRHDSAEICAKKSASRRGKSIPPEVVAKSAKTRSLRYHADSEAQRRASESRRGARNPMWGKLVSAETRRKISVGVREHSPNKGKHLLPETRAKIAASLRGRKMPDAMREARSGEKSWLWRGGTSRLPYSPDWTKALCLSIRERDRYTCRLCGKRQGDHTFPVHHIDYDKKNCDSMNLVTLCRGCHSRTNVHREAWLAFFRVLMTPALPYLRVA